MQFAPNPTAGGLPSLAAPSHQRPQATGGRALTPRHRSHATEAPLRADSIACHTRIGVAGMSMFSTPRCDRRQRTRTRMTRETPVA